MPESGKAKLDTMVIAVVGVVVAGAIYAGASVYRSHAAAADPQTIAERDAAQHMRVTLDPEQFVGEVKQAYQIAERNPVLFTQLHCWCGCDVTDGHKNLLDCYRDNHGSHCAICTGEAIEAEKLAAQGMPVDKIRDALRDRYGNGE